MRGPLLNDLLHGVEVASIVEGTIKSLLLGDRTGAQGLDVTHQRVGELLGHRGLDQDAGGGGAVLPGVERPCGGDALGGSLDVGIGEDDGGCLASQLEMDAGHVAGRLFGEIRARAHRTGERDQPGHRVGAHEAPGLPGAEHQVEDPGREDLAGDLSKDDGALGRVGTRLEHHRVACGQSGPDLPDEHHEGVVPRDDLPDDADGLAANLRVQALGVLPRGDTRLETGGPGEEPQLRGPCHDFLRPDHLGELTGVAALSLDETVGVGLQGVGESEQEQLPVRRRCQPPALECLEGGVVGGVDIGGP